MRQKEQTNTQKNEKQNKNTKTTKKQNKTKKQGKKKKKEIEPKYVTRIPERKPRSTLKQL